MKERSLINKLIKTPISGLDIKKLLRGKVKIIIYSDLIKYSSLDELLSPYGCVVILYMQKKIENGFYGHWCCIFKINSNEVEFFDPIGVWIDSELDGRISSSFRTENNLEYPLLSYLIYYTGQKYKLYYNHIRLQKPKTSTCGRHCVARLYNKNMSIEDYADYIYSLGPDPDVTVCLLTI